MEEHAWDMLLRRVPASQHEGLMLATNAGTDLVVQNIVRAEEKFLIIRGRTAGSTDNGKIMVVPYDKIVFISFAKNLSDAAVQVIFGDRDTDFAADADFDADDDQSMANDDFPMEQESPQPAQNALAANAGQPSKSVLLAKLRARLSENSRGAGT